MMNLKMNSVMSSVTVLVATFPTLLPHPPLNLLKKMSTSLDLLNRIPQLDRCHLSLVANALTPRMMNLILTSLRFMFTKLRKLKKKNGRPKAGDFNEADKELVLAAANIYRALLASQDAFPNTSMEVRLVKKAWKQLNAESGLKSWTITPTMVTIVSFSFIY